MSLESYRIEKKIDLPAYVEYNIELSLALHHSCLLYKTAI